MATLRARIGLAAKALTGLFSEQSGSQAYQILSGIYPSSTGATVQRGTKEILEAYSAMPWLRAVSSKIAQKVASTQWVLYAPAKGKPRNRIVQRASAPDRGKLIAKALDRGELKPIDSHIFLDAVQDANDMVVGTGLFRISQVHVDLVGESFWIKERNGLGAPVAFWPLPPHWIRETPTPSRQTYLVSFESWQGEIPSTEIVWFCDPDPANPYGRGSGVARSLVDELETDEYAARHTRMTFINRARPDLIIWPEETKTDPGIIDESNAQRLGERWRAEHQGFWRAALPFFATRKLGVKELSQNFADLQLTDLRRMERDIILQVWGMPPEQMGIVESSNRATADAADHILDKNVVVPRLEFWRAYLQARVLPEYDERLILDYVSPVSEDRQFQLQAASVAPHILTVDEWRKLAGHEPLEGGAGEIHMVQSGLRPVEDLSEAPPPPVFPGLPTAVEQPMRRTRAMDDGWRGMLAACKDAGDLVTASAVEKLMADDPDDLPDLSRRIARSEGATRRLVAEHLSALKGETDLDALIKACATRQAGAIERAIDAGSIDDDLKATLQDQLHRGFLTGANVGAEQAGIAIRRATDLPFNKVNPEALAWAQAHAGEAVTAISAATRDGIRAAIEDALEQGWSSEKTARVIRETLGLTERQSLAVVRFAASLADRAIAETKLLARVAKYADAQRKMRALMIARTELATAAGKGQQRLWDVAVEEGLLLKSELRKQWLTTDDEKLEPTCEQLGEEEPVEIDEPFPGGYMQPPAHPMCRCATGLVRVEKSFRSSRPQVDFGDAIAKAISGAIEQGFGQLRDALQQPIGKFDPNQPRDDHGQWTDTGGGATGGGGTDPAGQPDQPSASQIIASASAAPEATQSIVPAINHSLDTLSKARELVTKGATAAEVLAVLGPEAKSQFDKLFEAAKEADKDLASTLADVGRDVTGAEVVHGPIKSLQRSVEKVVNKDTGSATALRDPIRASIAIDTSDDVGKVVESLNKSIVSKGGAIVAAEDRFSNPTVAGYRDMNLNVRMPNGVVGEVQVHLKPILDVKNGKGHEIYQKWRRIAEATLTPESTAAMNELMAQQKALYDAAWLKATSKKEE